MAEILKDRKKDEMLRVRLPSEMAAAAKAKAAKEKRSLSAVVRDLLIQWLKK